MQKLAAGVVMVAMLALAGCNKDKGGPTGKDFSLSGPTLSTTIKQGDTQSIPLTVKKNKDFKQALELKDTGPAGLTAELSPKEIKSSDSDTMDVSLKVTAKKDAAVGEHTITVTATPEKGSAATVDVKVKVEKP